MFMSLDNKDFLEMAKLVYEGYPALNQNFKFSQALSMIDRLEKNIFVIRENGQILAVAVYFMVDDITLERIRLFVYDIRKPEGINSLMGKNGGHLHIIGLVSMEGNASIKRWINVICKELKPKTISWFKRNFTGFVIKEVTLCPRQP